MRSSGWIKASLAMTLCALGTGCDPGGAGASGVISLGPGVTAEGFTTLRICATPEPEVPPTSGFLETCELLENENVSDIKFPHPYEISAGLGTTDHEKWRLVIFLTSDETSVKPTSEEPFGLTLFSVGSCGAGYIDEYCGVTPAVDVTLAIGGGGPS
jgi:hypothetical protein